MDTGYFSNVDLTKLDVIVLPVGNYKDLLNEEGLARLTDWVKDGGEVIALGQALKSFAGKEGFNLKLNKEKTRIPSQNPILCLMHSGKGKK